MLKTVVIKAFEKAKKDIPGNSNKTKISEHISDALLNDFQYQLSGKSLRNLYDDSRLVKSNEDISINSSHTQCLCNYLGYENYDAFMTDYPENKRGNNNLLRFIQRHPLCI